MAVLSAAMCGRIGTKRTQFSFLFLGGDIRDEGFGKGWSFYEYCVRKAGFTEGGGGGERNVE